MDARTGVRLISWGTTLASESKKICVYCSASNDLAPIYTEAAVALGKAMGERGDTLVYGGSSNGLMGAIARSAHAAGGRVIGIIPKALLTVEFAFENADDLIITEDLRERKAGMEARADAFVALPGGIGTLEEVFEIMTLRALNLTPKPLVLLNTENFYDPLMELLQRMLSGGFIRRPISEIFFLAPDVSSALDHVDEAFSN